MTLHLVRQEIAKFIAEKSPGVLCLRGPWGVGKTYTWDTILQEKAGTNAVGLNQYSYVSLFGLSSLDALKAAIFENTVSTKQKNMVATEVTVGELMGKLTEKGRPWAKFLETAPIVKTWVPPGLTSALTFLSVRDSIVCFDDLERRGKGLELADVLGLASMLRDRRGCRVVLLLNEEKLAADDQETFHRYLEKVSDAALRFDPTSDEAVSIAVSGKTPISKRAADLCRGLGIRNIRIMKKIDRTLSTLSALVTGHDPRVLQDMERSAALFAWSHHDPDEAPTMDFLKGYNQFAGPEPGDDPKVTAWRALLPDYGYAQTSELDLRIMKGIVNGYFDVPTLLKGAVALETELKATDQDNSFEEAWEKYHASFDDNEQEVLAGIESAFRANASRITPLNLNGTVKLFKELGRGDKANELLAVYMEARKGEQRRFFNVEEYSFAENITEQEVIGAFNAKMATANEPRDFPELLSKLRHGWSDDELEALASIPVDEYAAIFKAAKGKQLRQILAGALSFDNVVGATPTMLEISRRARLALRAIAAESPINARRVAQRGIALE